MNAQIRQWIKENRQQEPWNNIRYEKGMLNDYAERYFSIRGKDIVNNSYYDLLDDELIELFDVMVNKLPESEQNFLCNNVAIGYTRTLEPNACCMKINNGYAVLFDQSFDTLLISLTEQYFAKIGNLIPCENYSYITNNSILSIYFGLCIYKEPIDTDNFIYRENIDHWVYIITIFILAHEIAHIILNHHQEKNTKNSFYKMNTGKGKYYKQYIKSHKQEFDADKWAINYILKNMVINGKADESKAWGLVYIQISWLFTILRAIEEMSLRIGETIETTHPSSSQRWVEISSIFLDTKNIDYMYFFECQKMNEAVLNSVTCGRMPKLNYMLQDNLIRTRIRLQK